MNSIKDNPMVKEIREDGSRVIRDGNDPATMRDVLHYYFGCVDMIGKRNAKTNAALIISALNLLLIVVGVVLKLI